MSNSLVDTFLIIEHARNGNGALLRDIVSIMFVSNLGLAGADPISHVQNKKYACICVCLSLSVCVCMHIHM